MDFWIFHGYSDISRILDISRISGYFPDIWIFHIKRMYKDVFRIFPRYFMDTQIFQGYWMFPGYLDISWILKGYIQIFLGYFSDIS